MFVNVNGDTPVLSMPDARILTEPPVAPATMFVNDESDIIVVTSSYVTDENANAPPFDDPALLSVKSTFKILTLADEYDPPNAKLTDPPAPPA